ncbi:MAG: hypothetical protein ACRDTV_22600 [Mycobacterium sp.]
MAIRAVIDVTRSRLTDPQFNIDNYRHETVTLLHLLGGVRRTGDPELAADLTAEVLATVLVSAARYAPTDDSAAGWLLGSRAQCAGPQCAARAGRRSGARASGCVVCVRSTQDWSSARWMSLIWQRRGGG